MIGARKKKAVRLQIIEALGGRCMWPGGCDVTDPDMLQVDHVNGGGGRERKLFSFRGQAVGASGVGSDHYNMSGNRSSDYYKHILGRVLEGSKDYQILCANHNSKKYVNLYYPPARSEEHTSELQ